MSQFTWRLAALVTLTGLVLGLPMVFAPASQEGTKVRPEDQGAQIGRSHQVPYRLTDTNHFLVRARINGKGPFNFLVDSGAPAVFIATETARKIGLKRDEAKFWTVIDQLDVEGGARLVGIKARVEDPFQLVGMNALGLPGASIDGILGFTVLARFRLEIDLTRDRMIWTRLDNEPRDPPGLNQNAGRKGSTTTGVQVMNAIGPLAKGLAFLTGKQPEEQYQPRGFLGVEWSERVILGQRHVLVEGVLGGSPAARGGVQPGDRIIRLNDRAIEGVRDIHTALAKVHSGSSVPIIIGRGPESDSHKLRLTLTAGEGL